MPEDMIGWGFEYNILPPGNRMMMLIYFSVVDENGVTHDNVTEEIIYISDRTIVTGEEFNIIGIESRTVVNEPGFPLSLSSHLFN